MSRVEPDRIVLLPLYPQFSTTTTESFNRIWYPAARSAGLSVPTSEICCWPEADGFVSSVAAATDHAIAKTARWLQFPGCFQLMAFRKDN